MSFVAPSMLKLEDVLTLRDKSGDESDHECGGITLSLDHARRDARRDLGTSGKCFQFGTGDLERMFDECGDHVKRRGDEDDELDRSES